MSSNNLIFQIIIALSLSLTACGSDPDTGPEGNQHGSLGDDTTAKTGLASPKGNGNDAGEAKGPGPADANTSDDCPCTEDEDSSDDSDDSTNDEDATDSHGSTVEQDLVFLREEEKLARDVYLRLDTEWQLRVFANIAKSEQTHMDAVKVRLDALGVPDPVKDDSVGVFANEELAHLYTELVDKGLTSKVAALEVGATIEDLDILDIEQMKHRTDDEAVLKTYNSLQCGSGNHLRAFVGLLEANGGTYEAQFSTQADLDAILAAPHQQCGSR